MPITPIDSLSALEILDSRGRPTLQVACLLADGATATASVPSGASTGTAEALELRDADPTRYNGLGCLQATRNVEGEILDSLRGRAFDQASLDQTMIDLDGTLDKSRLGANAILGVSLAFARAAAAASAQPLYTYFAALSGDSPAHLPRPTINLLSGGKHAGAQVAIQDVLVIAQSAATFHEALEITVAVYQAAADITHERYGMRLLTADEGGLAPPFASNSDMLACAVDAIQRAGYVPGVDVALAVDVAASHFYQDGRYHLDGVASTTTEMINHISAWLDAYPIISVEDALHEDDWAGWAQLREHIGDRALILGDDLLCTNPARIAQAIESNAANALLLKVNQIGTLSEALKARDQARAAGWHITISARSGETEDNWLADLAVGWHGDHLKVGSVTQSDRLAKYNRMLVIEAETGLRFK